MTSTMQRVQAGVPAGGQFAQRAHAEADLLLHDTATGFGDRFVSAGLTPDTVLDLTAPTATTVREPEQRDSMTIAKTLHMRHCDACHGADLSCIQIEETFLAHVVKTQASAERVRLSA